MASDGASQTSLPPVRRIVTEHSPEGLACIQSDELLNPVNPFVSTGEAPTGIIPAFTNLFVTEDYPAKSQGQWLDPYNKMIGLVNSSTITPPGATPGVVCRIVDFAPLPAEMIAAVGDGRGAHVQGFNPMHRTQSIDYAVVLSGAIELWLDDGSCTSMKEGEVCVQRASNHFWKNVSGKNCRMLFVLVPSQKVKVEKTGELLEASDASALEEKK